MPTYEYSCDKCGQQFEKYQSMLDKALTICPADLCGQKRWGKGKVKRAIGGGAGLIFKGSGFYITDYRSEGYKAAAKKESSGGDGKSSGDAKPAGDSKPGSDSKPAPAKSESKPAKPKPKAA